MPELPNSLTLLAQEFHGTLLGKFLLAWENIIFSFIIVCALSLVAYLATRKGSLGNTRLQNAVEALAAGLDDFVCGILGPEGRIYTPFIGTLFVYIVCMNLFGIVPFMKSSTASWSTTLALALCVFFYVQYAAVRKHGFIGYIDHLMGKPRGFLALTGIVPILMLILHLFSELVRPISLSLRLRSNIWGDDMLFMIITGFGLKGTPVLFFNTPLMILVAVVQAVVFCLLTTIYFALALTEE
jgi:F-type H+-transporting ATPase subunit a